MLGLPADDLGRDAEAALVEFTEADKRAAVSSIPAPNGGTDADDVPGSPGAKAPFPPIEVGGIPEAKPGIIPEDKLVPLFFKKLLKSAVAFIASSCFIPAAAAIAAIGFIAIAAAAAAAAGLFIAAIDPSPDIPGNILAAARCC